MKGLVFCIVAIFGLVGCGGGGNGGDFGIKDNPKPFNAASISESLKREYLKAINDARKTKRDCGRVENGSYVHDGTNMKGPADEVVWSNALYKAAMEHSVDMAAWNHNETNATKAKTKYTHAGSGTDSDWTAIKHDLGSGSTITERIYNNGYKGKQTLGENMAAGTDMDTPEEAVQAWIDSPGHCVNLMSSKYTKVGMALKEDTDSFFIYYWTQDFGVQ